MAKGKAKSMDGMGEMDRMDVERPRVAVKAAEWERVVFCNAADDGSDLMVERGDTVEISAAEWSRVKEHGLLVKA